MNAYVIPALLHNVARDSISVIIRTVCDEHKLTYSEIRAQTRKRHITNARHELMYLLKKHIHGSRLDQRRRRIEWTLTWQETGELVNRDHASAIHGCRKTKDLMETYRTVRERVERMEMKILPFINSNKLVEKSEVVTVGDFYQMENWDKRRVLESI